LVEKKKEVTNVQVESEDKNEPKESKSKKDKKVDIFDAKNHDKEAQDSEEDDEE
jgi:hypothetical protein